MAQSTPRCGLINPTFCDTFDAPAGTGNRSGQLDGTVWGVSRVNSNTNLGQNVIDPWPTTSLVGCSGNTSVRPDNDVIVCNGRAREAMNDGGTVAVLAMYPKQPFDFAGRTGVATFDVTNDTQGNHAAWPEFWMTDLPVPAPFAHEGSWVAAPKHGFGVRFGAATTPGQGANLAPGCPNDNNNRFTVDSAIVVRNYVADDSFDGGAIHVTPMGCVISSSGPNGGLNHIEVRVSQNTIDVWGTDAGTTSPLRHLAIINNANLTLTRGLLWIEDAHYNGNKFNSQGTHTFAWDNFGFDGPAVARDLAFDVPDPSGTDIGWHPTPSSPTTLTVPGVTGIANAAAAFLLFNFHHYDAPLTFTYVINGHSHTSPWPYGSDNNTFTWRTLALPIPLSDLVNGSNTVRLSANQQMGIANIGIVLAGAGGIPGGTPLPTATPTNTPVPPTATATSTAVPTNTPVPTDTPVPSTSTPTVLPTDTPQPTSTAVATNTSVPTATATATETSTPETCFVQVIHNGTAELVSKPLSFCTNQ